MDTTLAQLMNHIYELELEKKQLLDYIQENCPPPAPIADEAKPEGA